MDSLPVLRSSAKGLTCRGLVIKCSSPLGQYEPKGRCDIYLQYTGLERSPCKHTGTKECLGLINPIQFLGGQQNQDFVRCLVGNDITWF